MKYLVILLVFSPILTFAQATRFIYEYKFRADSTQTDSLKTEWMYLDINKGGSKYYSKGAFERDSLLYENVRKQMASGMRSVSISRQSGGDDVDYKVEKTHPDYKTHLITNVGNDSYRVLEDRKLNWTISADKKQLGEFKVQKATTDFGGRKWTAWFTTELPFQEGPYKFQGLPGMIVEVSDTTGSHRMELKGVKKITETKQEELDTKGKDIPLLGRKPIEVSRQQYVKLKKQYENDPVQGMREMLNRPNSTVKINMNGTEISDPKEILKTMEKVAKDEIARNNNQIELLP